MMAFRSAALIHLLLNSLSPLEWIEFDIQENLSRHHISEVS